MDFNYIRTCRVPDEYAELSAFRIYAFRRAVRGNYQHVSRRQRFRRIDASYSRFRKPPLNEIVVRDPAESRHFVIRRRFFPCFQRDCYCPLHARAKSFVFGCYYLHLSQISRTFCMTSSAVIAEVSKTTAFLATTRGAKSRCMS